MASEPRQRFVLRPVLLALLLLTIAAAPARAVQVYHSDAEAIALAFPGANRVARRTLVLDEAAKAKIVEKLGHPTRDRVVVVQEAFQGEQLLGRALVLEEIGKTLPFRFLVAITPEGRVDQVLLLSYREPRGHEIERGAFRAQYQGKALEDPIRRGKDIRNVTGATISVDSLSRGVRRALVLVEIASSVQADAATVSTGG